MSEFRGRGFPIVLAAPSGAGKTTLARQLVERNAEIVFSISATTRPARAHESDGVDYHFVSSDEFDRMIDGGELLEWAEVHDRKYGTPRWSIERALNEDQIVVLDIDVQGARQIRRHFPDSVLIFVLPPSIGELSRRLEKRGSEDRSDRMRRLRSAREELPAAAEFDYLFVNREIEESIRLLEAIVLAERNRVSRMGGLGNELVRMDDELAILLDGSN